MRWKRLLGVAGLAALALAGLWVSLRPSQDADGGEGQGVSSPVDVEATIGPTIQLGPKGQANSLVFGYGDLWVSSYDVPGPDAIARIDPATGEVLATIQIKAAPGWETGGDGMAVGAGAVWVTGGADETLLERVDPATDEVVATIRLGQGSGGDVAVDDMGVWVSASGRKDGVRLVRVDPATNSVVETIPIGGYWVREVFAFDDAIVVHTLDDGSRLTVVDPETNEVVASRPVRGGTDPAAFAATDGAVWAAKNRELLRIDPPTARVEGEPIRVGAAIGGSSLVADENGFWFQGYAPGRPSRGSTVDRFNPRVGRIDVSVDPPKDPIALALAPGSLWFLNYEGSVTRLDLR